MFAFSTGGDIGDTLKALGQNLGKYFIIMFLPVTSQVKICPFGDFHGQHYTERPILRWDRAFYRSMLVILPNVLPLITKKNK